MRERDQGRCLAVGAGAPADPDSHADGCAAVIDAEPLPAVDRVEAPDPDPRPPRSADVVQAVADFVEDLVEDAGPGDHDDE